jgi:transcriptional regulator with XRE-family HTH domain
MNSLALGQRLKVVRLTRVMSQVELAARAGITQQALSLIECGRFRGSVETWQRIAGVLDVSPMFFAAGLKTRAGGEGDANGRS